MDRILAYPVLVMFLGLGFVLLILCVVIAWTTRISFRLAKQGPPGSGTLFAVAFLQVLLGVLAVLALKTIKTVPVIFASGLGMMILSGLFLQKWLIKVGWRQCLRTWGIAAALQLVIVPVASLVLVMGLVSLLLLLYPPQY
jgi:hypothetical protein